jgi:hypothetical protein
MLVRFRNCLPPLPYTHNDPFALLEGLSLIVVPSFVDGFLNYKAVFLEILEGFVLLPMFFGLLLIFWDFEANTFYWTPVGLLTCVI